MIKESFIHQTMMVNLPTIYYEQSKAAKALLKPDTGRLMDLLDREPVHTAEEGKRYVMPTLQYLRFLDILYSPKSRGKNKMNTKRHAYNRVLLYNKPTWGIVFKEIRPYLRYGFTKDIQNTLRGQLEESLKNEW